MHLVQLGGGADVVEDRQRPEELEALEEAAIAAAIAEEERREQLGQVLVRHRDDAVTFRQNSGIEEQWAEDQAYYEGQDETSKTLYYKGTSASSPLIAKPKNRYRSKVFLNITRKRQSKRMRFRLNPVRLSVLRKVGFEELDISENGFNWNDLNLDLVNFEMTKKG